MPAVKAALFVAAFAAFPAQADLYRWVDPETGSVKFSNAPPPWYESGSGPQVDRIPYKQPGSRAPAGDQAQQEAALGLEARWREQLQKLTPQSTREEFVAFQGLTGELDKLDPGGKERRTRELQKMLQRFR